jgi:hypothetical protein
MSDTPTETATCQVIEGITSINAEIDLAIVNGVEEHVVFLEGTTTEVLPASVLPNPPVGEMLIQHVGLDVSNLVL